MKRTFILLLAIIILSSYAYADCCKSGNECYSISQQECTSGSWHSGDCVVQDSCNAVYECISGESSCTQNGYSGSKRCVNNIYGPCIITDQAYLSSIDRDNDGDPDATDCAPDDSNINWKTGCQAVEYYAPPAFTIDIIFWVRLILIAVIIYLVWRLWQLNPKKNAPKKGMNS